MTSSSDSCGLYTSTVQSGPSLLMLYSRPTLAFKPPICLLLILYFSICSLTTASRSWLFFFASCFLFLPLTPSGFFNGMLTVSEPRALNCYTFFRPSPLTLSVSRNLILTHLSLSGSPDSLLCNLIAPAPGLAFSFVMPRTLAAASSSLSGRAYLSLKFLSPLSLSLFA